MRMRTLGFILFLDDLNLKYMLLELITPENEKAFVNRLLTFIFLSQMADYDPAMAAGSVSDYPFSGKLLSRPFPPKEDHRVKRFIDFINRPFYNVNRADRDDNRDRAHALVKIAPAKKVTRTGSIGSFRPLSMVAASIGSGLLCVGLWYARILLKLN